jgi:hypothetical protein
MTSFARRMLFAIFVALPVAPSCMSSSDAGASCPSGTVACGNGCIPGSAVCCVAGSATSSSYCTNAAGVCGDNDAGACPGAFTSGPAQFCCSSNGSFGSNDCPSGQHHCGLLCWPASHACGPADVGDAAAAGGDDASTDDSPGVSTATFVGATYQTALGNAKGMASGCVYSFSVSGSLTLDIVGDTALSGNVTGSMSFAVSTVTQSPVGVACTQGPYTVSLSSNDISGTYAAVSATAGDGAAFNIATFAGKLVGTTLTGSLTINVTTYDLDGGGSYVTFPPVVLGGYTLTKQ